MQKQNRDDNPKHRRWIASLPCCVTLREGETQAAHIRAGCFSMGMKPCDSMIVPLHYAFHAEQHRISERVFWARYGGLENAKRLAKRLYEISGDTITALYEIRKFHGSQ